MSIEKNSAENSPRIMPFLWFDSNPAGAAIQAMLQINKLDIAALERAR